MVAGTRVTKALSTRTNSIFITIEQLKLDDSLKCKRLVFRVVTPSSMSPVLIYTHRPSSSMVG